MTRQILGIAGQSGQPSANVFEYKAAQLERPIEAVSASIVPGQLVPIQAVGRNPDGTLKSVQQRTLTITTTEGERVLVFPRAWGAKQLRAAAAAHGLLGGKVNRAHAAPPETAAEFVAASLDVIREVFGSGPSTSTRAKLDAPMGETEYRRVRFNLSRDYFARSPSWRSTISSGPARGSAAMTPNLTASKDSSATAMETNTSSSSATSVS